MPRELSCFTEAHFCVLPTQSNVYGMCHFSSSKSAATKTNREKVIVACLNGDITLFEYVVSEDGELKPVNNTFRFQYTSGKSEIISIDSFTKNDTDPPILVVGVTFKDQAHYGFSIYTAILKVNTSFYNHLQVATESGIPAPMDSLPCQVTHSQIYKHGTVSKIFLVSTIDRRVHMFKEHFCKKGESIFKESPISKYFPELDKDRIDDTIFFMDILYYNDNKRRLTCTGSQSGLVTAFTVDVPTGTVLSKTQAMGLGPVTSVVLFTDETDVPIPEYLMPLYMDEKKKEPIVHVLVCHALEVASIYRDVMKNGLHQQITLDKSYNYDSVLCGCVADVDFDGQNEIILGTFGQKILAYKFDSTAAGTESTKLLWEHSLQYPIHSLLVVDLTGDGLKDLAVLSARGLHILQKDITKAAGFISERVLDLVSGFDKLELQNQPPTTDEEEDVELEL